MCAITDSIIFHFVYILSRYDKINFQRRPSIIKNISVGNHGCEFILCLIFFGLNHARYHEVVNFADLIYILCYKYISC